MTAVLCEEKSFGEVLEVGVRVTRDDSEDRNRRRCAGRSASAGARGLKCAGLRGWLGPWHVGAKILRRHVICLFAQYGVLDELTTIDLYREVIM
jgi:hypothetical protein